MTRFALFALVAAAATFVAATPLKTPTEHRRAGNFPSIPGDNGSCQKVNELCAATIADPSTADRGLLGKSKECTLNAICWTLYGSEYDVDSWLEGHYGETAPASKDTARWPLEQYQTLLAPGTTVATQQSFIDAYFSLLATVNGPFPDASYVINIWTSLSAWTGFCATKEIPYNNLADWFQWSSTVDAPKTC